MKSKFRSSKLLLTIGVSIVDLVLLGLSVKYPEYRDQFFGFAGLIGAKTGIYILGESSIDKAAASPTTSPVVGTQINTQPEVTTNETGP